MTRAEEERRTHPRFVRSFELSGLPASGGVSSRLVASNLSLGGVYCTSDRDFPEMTRLGVRLMLPSRGPQGEMTEPLDLSAVVVRQKRLQAAHGDLFELALLFTALTAYQRERLARFLSHP